MKKMRKAKSLPWAGHKKNPASLFGQAGFFMSMSKLNRLHKDGIAILGTQGNYGATYKVC